jgi:transcriptional regulator with XRE-family HTH domain
LARTLRIACMRRRYITLDQLAAESGVAIGRLRKFLRDDDDVRQPSLSEALSIFAVLGATAATASLADIGMIAEDAELSEKRLNVAVAAMFSAGAELATAAADGVIDATEADATISAADRMIGEALNVKAAAMKARQR